MKKNGKSLITSSYFQLYTIQFDVVSLNILHHAIHNAWVFYETNNYCLWAMDRLDDYSE